MVDEAEKIKISDLDNVENLEENTLINYLIGLQDKQDFDYGLDDLEKLEKLLMNYDFGERFNSAFLVNRIILRRNELFEQMTSYDLKQKFAEAETEEKNYTADSIYRYVENQLEGHQPDAENAPLFADYYDIIKSRASTNEFSNIEELLQEYDQNNGLADLKISAEEYKQNYQDWLALVENDREKLNTYLAQTLKLTIEETDVFLAAVINRLALKKVADNALKELRDEINNQGLKYNIYYGAAKQEGYENSEKVYALACLNEQNAIFASRIAQKTGAKSTPNYLKETYKNFVAKNPKICAIVKNVALKGSVGLAFGPAGLAVLSVWETSKKVKESYARFLKSEQGQELSGNMWKNRKQFWKYIKSNKEERLKLGQAVTMSIISVVGGAYVAGSGGNFGFVGNAVTGIKGVANNTAVMAARRMASLAVTTAFGSQTAKLKNEQIAPKKAELMELLNKYMDNDNKNDETEPEKKGFFKKLFNKKSDVEKAYTMLTGGKLGFSKTDDTSLLDKLYELNLDNIDNNDKEKIIKLAQEIAILKSAKTSAIGGIVTAMAATEANEIAHDFAAESNADDVHSGADSHIDTHSENTTNNDTNVNSDTNENADTNNQSETNAQETVVTEESSSLLANQEGNHNLNYALNMTPTPTYHKLMELGVLSPEKAKELMEGRNYIPSRVLHEYLAKEAQFTPEQQEKFTEWYNDHEAREAEFNNDPAVKARAYVHNNSASHTSHESTGNHSANEGNSGTSTPSNKAGLTIPPESVEHNQEASGDVKESRIYTVKDKNGEQIVNVQVDPNNPNQAPAIHAAVDKYTGESRKLTIEGENVTAKYHEYKNGDEKIKIKYDNGMKQNIKIDGESGVQDVKYKNNEVAANTVGDPNGTKSDKVLRTVTDGNVKHTLIKDGDTGEKSIVTQTADGNITVHEGRDLRKLLKYMKQSGKSQ